MMEIRICRRDQVRYLIKDMGATHVLSLIDPGLEVKGVPSDVEHKVFHMFDIDAPDGLHAPQLEQIQEALDWARSIPSDAKVIVHCEAGVTRSTAMALGVWALHNPDKDIGLGGKWLEEVRPIACPNLLIAEYIDEILGFDGRFFKVADEVNEWRMINWFREDDSEN